MVRRIVARLLPKQDKKRALLLIFDHPALGRCVLHPKHPHHMELAKGDGTLTAARFYLKPYFKYLTDIDLHHYHRHEFKVDGVEYDVVYFDFPVVCDRGRALNKLIKAGHQFIPTEQHKYAEQISNVFGRE